MSVCIIGQPRWLTDKDLIPLDRSPATFESGLVSSVTVLGRQKPQTSFRELTVSLSPPRDRINGSTSLAWLKGVHFMEIPVL
jgi:hypothetical protein